jgi:pyrroloquinoline quinone biosynthesis protein E
MRINTLTELLENNWNRPDRVWNLLKSTFFPFSEYVSYGPISADIETTLVCNLGCVMCHRRELARKRKEFYISLEQFKSIIDKMPTLLQVKLQGMGEPLLTPELFEMVKYAKSKGIVATFVSNGKSMNRENAKQTIQSGLDRVYFSVDTDIPEQYAEIRVGGNLEVLIQNMAGFMDERKALHSKKPLVGIWTLVFQGNLTRLRGIVDIAKKTGVDELIFQTEVTDRGKGEWKSVIQALIPKKKNEMDEAIADALRYAKEQGVALFIHTYIGGMFKKTPEQMCQWAWKSIYITSQGDVSPCCIIADADVIGLGNIYDESGFPILWNGKHYQSLRKQFLSGDIPEACKGCYKMNQ